MDLDVYNMVQAIESKLYDENGIDELLNVLGASVYKRADFIREEIAGFIEEERYAIDIEKELNSIKNITEEQRKQLHELAVHNKALTLLMTLNKLGQDHLLRPPGSERQQLKDDYSAEMREMLTGSLARLGFIDEVKPRCLTPDALLVFGASQAAFTNRMNSFLQYLEDEYIDPQAVYLLGGARPLWALDEPVAAELIAKQLESSIDQVNAQFIDIAKGLFGCDADLAFIKGLPTKEKDFFRIKTREHFISLGVIWPTELDMMMEVSGQFKTKYDMIGVNTPMQKAENGAERRPNTRDTIVEFKKQYGHLCKTVLGISSQPHIIYQKQPLLELLPENQFEIEVIGKGVDRETYNIPVALDAVARAINAGMSRALGKFLEREISFAPEYSSWVNFVTKSNDTIKDNGFTIL